MKHFLSVISGKLFFCSMDRYVDRKGERLLKSLYNEMIHTRKGLDYAQISIS
ncbi:hypothetical protein PAXY110619_24655 [Paenibacillus xylanexedens]|uniref:Transposase n=1 Tax=Paenibacillus xylanexedens TaxID=528191 RepID=A0ABS4RZP0_PAEXY|nr:hypothetical protein [Paenibacillus xylanexedens]